MTAQRQGEDGNRRYYRVTTRSQGWDHDWRLHYIVACAQIFLQWPVAVVKVMKVEKQKQVQTDGQSTPGCFLLILTSSDCLVKVDEGSEVVLSAGRVAVENQFRKGACHSRVTYGWFSSAEVLVPTPSPS